MPSLFIAPRPASNIFTSDDTLGHSSRTELTAAVKDFERGGGSRFVKTVVLLAAISDAPPAAEREGACNRPTYDPEIQRWRFATGVDPRIHPTTLKCPTSSTIFVCIAFRSILVLSTVQLSEIRGEYHPRPHDALLHAALVLAVTSLS